MERREHMAAGLGLALTLTFGLAGCRTPRSEVPPSKTFSGTGQPPAALPFGSSGNAANGFSALPGGSGDGAPGSSNAGQLGTPGTNSGNFGVPSTNSFGPPGTVNGAGVSAGAANPLVGVPQTGTGPASPGAYVAPPAEITAPTQLPAPTQNPFP